MLANPTGPGLAARADARRNRALVLAAAQDAFAERGLSVSLVEVARRAGVGAGTVHRHFPTKAHLLEAVMQQRVDRLAALASGFLAADDAGTAFFMVCVEVVRSASANQALCGVVMSDDGWPRAVLDGAGARFNQALGALLHKAQRQGAVRADITLPDLVALFTGCVAIQRLPGNTGRLARPAALVLDSLRGPTAPATVTKLLHDPQRHNEIRRRNETGGPHCPICDTPIRPTRTGRPARYCSAACRQKAHRERSAARSTSV
ncbi:TetR/AcrR family transcriptional regulator [Nocardia sp. NPDC052566]|uniref:TetR/AcrR family transcriptional regulator n=1 Tax=Nocardia sp. NPDC052566 TaxID=3364330 RepID=UPI0037C60C78